MEDYEKSTSAIPSAAKNIPAKPSVIESELSFAVAGDIMAHETQILSAKDEKCDCYDFMPVFAPTRPLFSNADIAIANLETTLPGKNYSGYPAFGAPDSLVDAVTAAGINLLTTANNHTVDKGKAAFLRTLRVLEKKGIPHLGTYASPAEFEKQRIFVMEKNGISIAMMNYTYGTNGIKTPPGTVVNRIDKKQVSEDIALARARKVDVIIVLYHFGEEYLNKPDAYQKEMVAHALAKGADIVLGGHPHHVQPYEMLRHSDELGHDKQRLVAYSLGNFVSAQRRRYTDGGMVLYFTLKKRKEESGKVTIDITDVHHKLVWVYVEHVGVRRQYHILPIEAYLGKPSDIKLTPDAIEDMKRFRTDAEVVLGVKEGERRTLLTTTASTKRAVHP